MTFIPGYHELKQRIRCLEQVVSEYETLKQESSGISNLNEDVIKAMNDGLVLTDMHETVIFVNPGFVSLVGYSPEEIIGRGLPF